ncbi:MAG: hypothetical protein UT58_C0019G0004 [Microgenomates group bacterium GW2011_GWC1_39_7b]|uniref:Uncharacterized protein n=2 Tax=Candidatus Daviesiibacteriota TaxID=1752718 RepID=A0A1F5MZD1_9BACT|nr:MAG: hypothetical protein UT58_C0019G0004 [Microgenomates group bacterium GW2011_GWC1_39_7b]KKS13549.1 MAG: hypothetical protein UU67_C0022G0015 [Candidatus Daviesbacteria bacterium GW2011_GWB1_41_5]OGE70756.1 MAG: hypothetical protein A2617_01580 [Candidatus Daviesbacteria bacterium RIFOXYD1_FULL_41_10]
MLERLLKEEWQLLILIVILTVSGSLLLGKLQESYYCGNVDSCIVWGSKAGFWIINFFYALFGFLALKEVLISKFTKRPVSQTALVILAILTAVYIIFILASFRSYIKVTPKYLEVGDFTLNAVSSKAIHQVLWEDIKGIGIQLSKGKYSCHYYPYLFLKEGKSYELPANLIDDQSALLRYLRDFKGFPVLETKGNC